MRFARGNGNGECDFTYLVQRRILVQKNIMQKKTALICALLVAAMFQLILTSATAQAAAPNACKAIDDAYRKQITSGMHLKITRTSSGEMSGRNGMIYGADDTTTCNFVRDEAANGEAAAVYRQHHINGDETYDTLIWVSKSSGLPLRQEQDADFGQGKKGHESLLFKYSK
jgi:hypothetical protein